VPQNIAKRKQLDITTIQVGISNKFRDTEIKWEYIYNTHNIIAEP
jgi:hypothetical protein